MAYAQKQRKGSLTMKHYAVTEKAIKAWSKDYQSSPVRQLATLALAKSDLKDVEAVSKAAGKMRYKFSIDIKTLDVTNQKHSGRCWLFAATNVLREKIAKELNLEQFELSQSYLAFWDKFERANYFLESMLDTADLAPDDRTVSFILQTGVHDGGQWDMFANIVEKYGVVPKDVFDETYQSSNTNAMNHVLNRNLKICAVRLREMVKAGKTAKEIHEAKDAMLGRIYGFLCSCYGEPPRTFDFEYVDKDGNYAIEKDFLRTFAFHYETGEPIPDDLIERIVKSRNFLAAYGCLRQVSFGLLDMAYYTKKEAFDEDIIPFEKKAWEKAIITKQLPNTCMTVQFGHIMAGGYAAGYYSYKWAEVLDADAFSVFKANGIFNQETAQRFRDNILSKGGTEHPMTLYKRFRGQEPTIDALLKRNGIIKS